MVCDDPAVFSPETETLTHAGRETLQQGTQLLHGKHSSVNVPTSELNNLRCCANMAPVLWFPSYSSHSTTSGPCWECYWRKRCSMNNRHKLQVCTWF